MLRKGQVLCPELYMRKEIAEVSLAWHPLYLSAAKSTWEIFAPVCYSNGHFVVKAWFRLSDGYYLKKRFLCVCAFLNRWCNIKISGEKKHSKFISVLYCAFDVPDAVKQVFKKYVVLIRRSGFSFLITPYLDLLSLADFNAVGVSSSCKHHDLITVYSCVTVKWGSMPTQVRF